MLVINLQPQLLHLLHRRVRRLLMFRIMLIGILLFMLMVGLTFKELNLDPLATVLTAIGGLGGP